MIKTLLAAVLLSISFNIQAQNKKPLTHAVYDGWKSVGERVISNNGKYVVYTIVPQEGDATLYIQQSSGDKLIEVPRAYNVKFSEDNRFVVFKIKPTFQQTRDARIKKKKPSSLKAIV